MSDQEEDIKAKLLLKIKQLKKKQQVVQQRHHSVLLQLKQERIYKLLEGKWGDYQALLIKFLLRFIHLMKKE